MATPASLRRRTARSNVARSESRIFARGPEQLAGDSRKIRGTSPQGYRRGADGRTGRPREHDAREAPSTRLLAVDDDGDVVPGRGPGRGLDRGRAGLELHLEAAGVDRCVPGIAVALGVDAGHAVVVRRGLE